VKLLYADQTIPNATTFKRLLLLGSEICFADRPSVTFQGGKNLSTIGHAHPFRNAPSTEGEPVRFRVLDTPDGPGEQIYLPYIEKDIANPAFVETVLGGLQKSTVFAQKFIQPAANYDDGVTGEMLLNAIKSDQSLRMAKFTPNIDGRKFFNTHKDTAEGRRVIVNTALIEASIKLTTMTLLASQNDVSPVSDDPFFAKLLAMRLSASEYIGGNALLAPYLGFEIVKSVIPDEVLQKLRPSDVMEYREQSQDAYKAWEIEVNKLSVQIDGIQCDKAKARVLRILAKEIKPQMIKYRNEMVTVRDKLFSDLLKGILKIHVPALSIAYLADANFGNALITFVGSAAPAIAPPIIEYVRRTRAGQRKHAISYLVGLSKPD
jgi:hypothetical protein